MAALVCCLSLSVTSCKDDDKNDESGGESSEELGPQDENEAAMKFWNVAGELVGMSEATDDYKDKTFEPIIGKADANDPQARVVYTNSAAAAAESFAHLVDIEDMTEETATRSWSDPDVGTLTYTKVADGTAWATVDVNIKQVPHLTKIIYREPSQTDENGGVKDHYRAWYRFGDVVLRENKDGEDEYWVCVRPAFDPEGKGDSHWVTISPVPKKNQYKWTYENKKKKIKRTYVLPTGLGTSEEHMQNFAEMLFAIFHPKTWHKNVEKYAKENKGKPSGMKMFHDFHRSNLDYHNMFFWNNVRTYWSEKEVTTIDDEDIYTDICNKVFGMSFEEMQKLIDKDGLYLLYNGKTWKSGSAPTLYQAHYFNTPGGVNANMQTKKPFSTVKKSVYNEKDPSKDIELDISTCTLEKPYYINEKFFGDSHPRFIIRHATGDELKGSEYFNDLPFPMPAIREEYRYYGKVFSDIRTPEVTKGNEADVPE